MLSSSSFSIVSSSFERLQQQSDTLRSHLASTLGSKSPEGDFCPGPILLKMQAQLDSSQDTYESQLTQLVARLAELRANENSAEVVQQNIAASKQTTRELEAEKHKLKQEELHVPQLQAEVSRNLEDVQKRLEVRRREIERAQRGEDDGSETLEALTRSAALYKRMGLGIKKLSATHELKFILRLIDPAKPDKEFTFVVGITADETYNVRDVRPSVPGLEELITKLNATNDFSTFVRTLRKKFQELVAQKQ